MIIIGADYHPGFQSAVVDTDTGGSQERSTQRRRLDYHAPAQLTACCTVFDLLPRKFAVAAIDCFDQRCAHFEC